MEVDQKVKLQEELQPTSLAVSEDLGGGEIFQVLVVCNNINQSCGALKVMTLVAEGFEDHKEFLVMGIIVSLRRSHSAGVEHNWLEFTIGASDGENTSDSIVGGISFNGERSIGDPMSKDRSGGKGLLQGVESGATLIGEIPRRSLVGQAV